MEEKYKSNMDASHTEWTCSLKNRFIRANIRRGGSIQAGEDECLSYDMGDAAADLETLRELPPD